MVNLHCNSSWLQKLTFGLLALLIVGSPAAQTTYPEKPIRIVVPYPPGGSNDYLARLFGPKLTENLGRQVVIDNRGGGNTIIGHDVVAKSAPDGYSSQSHQGCQHQNAGVILCDAKPVIAGASPRCVRWCRSA